MAIVDIMRVSAFTNEMHIIPIAHRLQEIQPRSGSQLWVNWSRAGQITPINTQAIPIAILVEPHCNSWPCKISHLIIHDIIQHPLFMLKQKCITALTHTKVPTIHVHLRKNELIFDFANQSKKQH